MSEKLSHYPAISVLSFSCVTFACERQFKTLLRKTLSWHSLSKKGTAKAERENEEAARVNFDIYARRNITLMSDCLCVTLKKLLF